MDIETRLNRYIIYIVYAILTLEAALLALDGVNAEADEQQNGGHAAASHAQQVAHLQRFCAYIQLLLLLFLL